MPVPQPIESLVLLTHVIYALHAFAALSGVAGSVTVLGSFIAGIPSLIAVVLNYLKRDAVRGTWLESHFRWQIRTFWFAWAAVLLGWLLVITLFGAPIGVIVWIVATVWVIYRVARGWWRLGSRLRMPIPGN